MQSSTALARLALIGITCALPVHALPTQDDFYAEGVLRTIEVVFSSDGWHEKLTDYYGTGQYVVADLIVDGVIYPNVGVQHKGDSSYTDGYTLKESLKITLDAFVPGQDVQGYDKLSLDNGRQSSVFSEVVYLWLAAEYVPAPRANLIHVLAGTPANMEDLGVYTNTERVDKQFFAKAFGDDGGHRYERDEYNPLLILPFEYQGSEASNYVQDYSAQGGDSETLYEDIRDVADVLENSPTASVLEDLDGLLDVDAFIRTLALESMARNVDGLWRGNNYFLYEDLYHGGRLVPLPWDADQTMLDTLTNNPPDMFCGPGDAAECPLSRLLEHQEWDRRLETYHQHFLDGIFHWDVIGPRLLALRDLAAPKILGSPHDLIVDQSKLDFAIGRIQQHIADRRAFLTTIYLLDYERPTISAVTHSPVAPSPADTVTVTAEVALPGIPLGEVFLYTRERGSFGQAQMFDDGLSGDGVAGDGVYGVQVPAAVVAAAAGEHFEYYLEARAADISPSNDGVEIFPFAGEFNAVQVPVGYETPASPVRVTELLYSGGNGEFVELTNLGSDPVDLTGWTLHDESPDGPGFDLSLLGVLAPGESALVTDVLPGSFRAGWGLAASVPVAGPNHAANFGRNDQVNLLDPAGELRDRLTYGDQDFPGSVRPKDTSIIACDEALGADLLYSWEASFAGDGRGTVVSSQGDLGSPGTYAVGPCGFAPVCAPAVPNSSGQWTDLVAFGDRLASGSGITLVATGLPQDQLGYLLVGQVEGYFPAVGGSQGTLCLGSPIGRDTSTLQSSGVGGSMSFDAQPTALFGPNGELAANPGERWLFQVWHRDLNPGPTSNFSAALAVTWR